VTGAGGLLATEVLAPPEVMKKRLASQVNALWGAIRQRSIFLPAVFVFLWQVGTLQQKHCMSVVSCSMCICGFEWLPLGVQRIVL